MTIDRSISLAPPRSTRRASGSRPTTPSLLGALANIESYLGRWDSASVRLARAALLDPRSASIAGQLADMRSSSGNTPRRIPRPIGRSRSRPTNPELVERKVMVPLARGDLDGARAVVRAAAQRIESDDAAQLPRELPGSVLGAGRRPAAAGARPAAERVRRRPGLWGIVLAQLYHLRGDRARAAVYADSARLALEEQSRAAPDDAQRHVLLGLALAYLGRKADAMREGERGVALAPISKDATSARTFSIQLARIYLLSGEPEKALDQLEPLLRLPYYLSPGWLRVDPTFDPLRNNPRFQKLVEGTA